MSWEVFKSEVLTLSGNPHVTEQLFASTVANAYNSCMSRHIETLSGGGAMIGLSARTPILEQSILSRIQQNVQSHQEINIIEQIGPYIQNYWKGATYIGPAGSGVITSTGTWTPTPLPKNLDFRVFVNAFVISARAHILSMVGVHTMFTPPGATVPWSGVYYTPVG